MRGLRGDAESDEACRRRETEASWCMVSHVVRGAHGYGAQLGAQQAHEALGRDAQAAHEDLDEAVRSAAVLHQLPAAHPASLIRAHFVGGPHRHGSPRPGGEAPRSGRRRGLSDRLGDAKRHAENLRVRVRVDDAVAPP